MTKTKTRVKTKTMVISAAVLGLAAAAGLGFNAFKNTNIIGSFPGSSISVVQDGSPASTNVVAGKDAWVPLAKYKATSASDDMIMDRVTVNSISGGDNADYRQIAVSVGGVVKGTATFDPGTTGKQDVDLTSNPISIPKGGSVSFELWAKLASISPSSAVNGAWQGVARSGHKVGLGLASDITTGSWDANYSGKLNIRFINTASGAHYYAAKGAAAGNPMILRATMPIVTNLYLSNNVLANHDTELKRLQIGADAAGPVSIKQIAFQIAKSTNASVGRFRLYKGAYELSSSDYKITNAATGADLKTTTISTSTNSFIAVVSFANEDAIRGSGQIYSLHATTQSLTAGNSIATSFYRNTSAPVVTGNLINKLMTSMSVASPDIFAFISDKSYYPGTFVWSDMSELPHSPSVPGSSRDWTNDTYVQDLTQTSILSN